MEKSKKPASKQKSKKTSSGLGPSIIFEKRLNKLVSKGAIASPNLVIRPVTNIVKDVDGPSKKYIGPYTKKEHGTYLAVQQENSSPTLKRKKMPSSSPVDSNLKKVRIALDSDDEDENIMSYVLPAIENVPEVINLNFQSRKNIVEDQATEPFIMTPSPELIKDVLGGFSKRCSKNGTWLMGLPDFCADGESSSQGSKLCLDDLKYSSSLHQLGNEIAPSLITPELEKEFLEHNDLISAWTALDVSALETATIARLQRGVAQKALLEICARRKKSLERIAKLEEKAEAVGDNKKLIMRQKELDKLVLDHQEVSRERAISEDKLRALIAELEKENQRLEFARQAEEEKTASALQELDVGRQQLFESCKLVGRALKKLGAEPAQLEKMSRALKVVKNLRAAERMITPLHRFFSWERQHRGGSLRDFVLEFRSHRLKNNSDSTEFWNNFQPSERQLRIRKRRYSIVPYTGEPTPLRVVFPSE
uniref:Uncharacterized protein n=1 Tax=Oryza meridionalis TaxID=40149 RepID=A0A0E0D2E4_9ORYZ